MSELTGLRFQKQVVGRSLRNAQMCLAVEAYTAASQHIEEAIYALVSPGNAKVVHTKHIKDIQDVQALSDELNE